MVERLPGGYRGCLDGEEPVKADRFTCESGQWLVTYDDRFWAVVGGDIGEARAKLRNDRNYLADLRVCSG